MEINHRTRIAEVSGVIVDAGMWAEYTAEHIGGTRPDPDQDAVDELLTIAQGLIDDVQALKRALQINRT